jgi:hypothetical protein
MKVWRMLLASAAVTGAVLVVPNPSNAILLCDGQRVTVDLAAGQGPTSGNDVIRGTTARDVIIAGRGNDTICARGGPDTIHGGPGRDKIIAGDGMDAMLGSSGRDRCLGGNGNDAGGRCETLDSARKCASAYPTICVPPPAPDLDCGDIPWYRNFRANPRDPHNFDTNDANHIGCETVLEQGGRRIGVPHGLRHPSVIRHCAMASGGFVRPATIDESRQTQI